MSGTGYIKPAAQQRASQEALDLIRRIDDMLEETDRHNNLRYEWAIDTLTGIRDTVERTGRVTYPQHRAIDNIENGGLH